MDNGNQWELTVITTRIGGCVFSNKPYFLYYIIWLAMDPKSVPFIGRLWLSAPSKQLSAVW